MLRYSHSTYLDAVRKVAAASRAATDEARQIAEQAAASQAVPPGATVAPTTSEGVPGDGKPGA